MKTSHGTPMSTNAPFNVRFDWGTLSRIANASAVIDHDAHNVITKLGPGCAPSHPTTIDATKEKPSVTGSRQHRRNETIQPITRKAARIWMRSASGPRSARSTPAVAEAVAGTNAFDPITAPFQ